MYIVRSSAIGVGIIVAGLLTFPNLSPAQKEHHAGHHEEMSAQMEKMDQEMKAAPMTGNADLDFAIMMIPHHQGAVDMAKTQLKYGKDEKLRAMAKQIIDSQEREIKELRDRVAALKKAMPESGDSASTMSHSTHGHQM